MDEEPKKPQKKPEEEKTVAERAEKILNDDLLKGRREGMKNMPRITKQEAIIAINKSEPAGVQIRRYISYFTRKGFTASQLSSVAQSATAPIGRRIAARRLLEAATKGRKGLEESKFVLEQTAGKPKEFVEHEHIDGRRITDRLAEIRSKLDGLEQPSSD